MALAACVPEFLADFSQSTTPSAPPRPPIWYRALTSCIVALLRRRIELQYSWIAITVGRSYIPACQVIARVNVVGKLGPYSKQIVLGRADGRTKQGRLVKSMRRELLAHLGGAGGVTPMQRALIERACMLQLRVATLDERLLDGDSFTEYDSKTYLAFSNSLTRTLTALGIERSAATPTAPATRDNLLEAVMREIGSATP